MWQVVAGFLGGMGLFFMGLRLTGEGVKRIAGRRFRNLFLRWTRFAPAAAGLGVLAGLLFQSASGISLILASLIGAGVTTVRRALPVLFGANAGVACLVLVAVVDIRVLVLLLLGVSCLILSFERPARLLDTARIAFGVGLLLFGLQTVRTGVAPLANAPWFHEFLRTQALALPWYFVIGTVAGFVLQTSAGVTILAITLSASGILDANDGLAIMFGSLLGTSLLNRCYAAQFTGARKRLVMGQALFNLVGLALFLPLFVLEEHWGLPLLEAWSARIFPELPERLAAIRMGFDCVTALVLFCLGPLYNRLLERLCPDVADSLDSLAYVKELTEVSPEVAVILIDKEQGRLVRHLSLFTDRLRRARERGACPHVRDLSRSLTELPLSLETCLTDMLARELPVSVANAVVLLQGNQPLLRSLGETVRQGVEELAFAGRSAAWERLGEAFTESLDALLIQAGEVFFRREAADWEVFLRLVSDKGPAMDGLRGRYLHEQGGLTGEEQLHVMRVTGLYERIVWLLQCLGERQQRFLFAQGAEVTALAEPEAGREGR